MHKKMKKLTLHKETLRSLQDQALRNAAGAARTNHCDTVLDCPIGTSFNPTGCVNTHCFATCGIECA